VWWFDSCTENALLVVLIGFIDSRFVIVSASHWLWWIVIVYLKSIPWLLLSILLDIIGEMFRVGRVIWIDIIMSWWTVYWSDYDSALTSPCSQGRDRFVSMPGLFRRFRWSTSVLLAKFLKGSYNAIFIQVNLILLGINDLYFN